MMPPPADEAVPSEDAGLETLEADDHVDMQADERGAEEGCNMMDCGPWGPPICHGWPYHHHKQHAASFPLHNIKYMPSTLL